MANIPKKPQKGDRVLQSLYNTVCDIVDYLPSLNVVGDNKTTYVNHSAGGTTIHAVQPHSTIQGKTNEYIAGSGIVFTSGNIINAKLSAGPNINIDYNSGWLVISGTPAGSGGGGTVYIEDNFGVPNLSALNFNNEPLANDGNGLTWLIPVSAGQQFTYSTGASGNVNASYAPAKGKSGSSFAITRDVLSTIPSDGYIRITAFDDGLHHNQCLRVFDGTTNWNEGLPLYKFSNWSSAVIPSGGRYTTVQLTSTRLNAQEQEEIYTLPNPIINNMLSGGNYITIQETDEYDVKLQYPLINCTLHGDGTTVTIDENGTISAIGGGGGTTVIASGVGYPDHSKLFPDNYPAMSGLGISWLIPVSAGVEYRFYTDATGGEDEEENTIQVAYGKFAPSVGETGMASSLTNGVDFVPDSNGWVRISVFDSGRNEGSCLRFYVNDEDGQYATPLYRFHGFTNYEAGAGIAINSGIISCMLQTNAGLSGLTSTALTTNTYPPVTTGIAIGLSTEWAQDLAKINQHTLVANKNKVLSSNNYGTLVWADNVQIPPPVEAGFKVPDFAKLQVTNDAGEQALGLGNTFIIPVSGGSTVRYSADGGTIIAKWAPVKGSSKTAFEVTTTNKTTTDDGYVRISVIDPGTLDYGCLRLYVDNKDIPLHKFAKFNYSSGAIYEAGRYMQIQTTSTRINPQTEQEEQYTLENPIIHNMLTGGNHITIQQTEMVGGVEQQLKYPRINCDLTGDNQTVFINENGVISAQAAAPSTVYDKLSQGSGILLTKLSDGKTKIDCTVQGGGGIANFAPDYSYLSASEDAGMTTNGLGVTFLLPVNAGDTYRVESTGPTVVCTFAPVANSSTETTNVAANSTLTADTDGWVRVSVIDPGTSNGACVRFLVNGVPFANGLPLYKSKIMQNLTGDGSTIQIDGNQIKCISTPPPSSSSDGTAVNAKTSFCFTPDIYYAEPNVTYFTSYKHDIDTEDDLAYTVDDLRWQFDTENIDEGGDIVIALPEVDYPCMVKVTNFDNTYTTVVTQDGKYIVGDDGGNQGWASGQQSDKVGMNETKIYVFQPTPIHWSSSYSGISAAIEARDGVWWMQTFT